MLKKSKINLLVVEDDKDFGRVLLMSLTEAGYQVELACDPQAALSSAGKKKFHAVVVDCLLPKMSGVELVKKLKAMNKDLRSVLITGVYKDESFFHEALAETKAYDLLLKPFEPQTLILTIENMLSDLIGKSRRFSLELFTKENFETNDIRKVLKDENTFFGLELPYLYSLIFSSKLSGKLLIIYDKKKFSSIGFSNGEITHVQLDDKESFFGALLVEKGFTTLDELESGLKMKKNKFIGEKLVNINAMSPHAIKIIQKEQVRIRLSKTISRKNLKIEFNEGEGSQLSEKEKTDFDLLDTISISKSEFIELLSEWILSRISTDWLRSFYIPWYGHTLNQTDLFSKLEGFKSLCVLNSKKNDLALLISQIKDKTPLSQIIEEQKKSESFVLKAIYFLLLNKMVYFREEKAEFNNEKAMKRLEKIAKDIKGKNHFELLGLSRIATQKDILNAYHHFAHFLHPDRLHKEATKKLQLFSKKIFSQIVMAYNVLKDEKTRKKYIENIDKAESSMKIELNQALEKTINLLLNGQYEKAFKKLEKLKEKKNYGSLFMVYYIWAFIQSKNYQFMIAKKDLVPYLDSLFNQVPLEERHNQYYFYVRGLFYKLISDQKKAKKCFLQSIALDSNFKLAFVEVEKCKKAVS